MFGFEIALWRTARNSCAAKSFNVSGGVFGFAATTAHTAGVTAPCATAPAGLGSPRGRCQPVCAGDSLPPAAGSLMVAVPLRRDDAVKVLWHVEAAPGSAWLCQDLFPAHAGMTRLTAHSASAVRSVPRTRRDDPSTRWPRPAFRNHQPQPPPQPATASTLS